MSGTRIQAPTAEYGGSLPKTAYAGRAGLETLIRRLVLGGNYKNIRQITGTVTGVSRDRVDPQFLESVTVRTPDGTMNIPATLVVGKIDTVTMQKDRTQKISQIVRAQQQPALNGWDGKGTGLLTSTPRASFPSTN